MKKSLVPVTEIFNQEIINVLKNLSLAPSTDVHDSKSFILSVLFKGYELALDHIYCVSFGGIRQKDKALLKMIYDDIREVVSDFDNADVNDLLHCPYGFKPKSEKHLTKDIASMFEHIFTKIQETNAPSDDISIYINRQNENMTLCFFYNNGENPIYELSFNIAL